MTSTMLIELNKFGDELKEFGINIRSHIFKIIDHAKKVSKDFIMHVDRSFSFLIYMSNAPLFVLWYVLLFSLSFYYDFIVIFHYRLRKRDQKATKA